MSRMNEATGRVLRFCSLRWGGRAHPGSFPAEIRKAAKATGLSITLDVYLDTLARRADMTAAAFRLAARAARGEDLAPLLDARLDAPASDGRTIFECRCCSASVSGKTDGAFDAPGWRRIGRIDGPDAICPRCSADPHALDDLREEYPDVHVIQEGSAAG